VNKPKEVGFGNDPDFGRHQHHALLEKMNRLLQYGCYLVGSWQKLSYLSVAKKASAKMDAVLGQRNVLALLKDIHQTIVHGLVINLTYLTLSTSFAPLLQGR